MGTVSHTCNGVLVASTFCEISVDQADSTAREQVFVAQRKFNMNVHGAARRGGTT